MGYEADDFIQPRPKGSGPDAARIAAWTWRPVPEPDLSSLLPRGQEWEMTRYRAYQAQLAGHPIGDTFSQAAGFLRQASAGRLNHAGPARPRHRRPPAEQADSAGSAMLTPRSLSGR